MKNEPQSGAYVIEGGYGLYGETEIMSAKNAVLPIIACCAAVRGEVRLGRCEQTSDASAMLDILRSLGGKCRFEGTDIIIDCRGLNRHTVNRALTSRLRSSVFILGPLVAALRKAEISYPGGCDIGVRPIDIHTGGLAALGVSLTEEGDKIVCDGSGLHGGETVLPFPSVGATENLMMAAMLCNGRTVIRNAAQEPEIADLQNFINACGGNVRGAGGRVIIVDGVSELHGTDYIPIGDRIAAGTFLIGGAMCGGRVAVKGVDPSYLKSLTELMNAAGAEVTEYTNALTVQSSGRLKTVRKVETRPYPGFPTDLQAPMTAMMAVGEGKGYIIENLFENRFRHVPELRKMGADITVCGRAATVRGKHIHCAEVAAEDLRGGAALVLAALKAEGRSVVRGINHIDRGYYDFDERLTALGAHIKRVNQ